MNDGTQQDGSAGGARRGRGAHRRGAPPQPAPGRGDGPGAQPETETEAGTKAETETGTKTKVKARNKNKAKAKVKKTGYRRIIDYPRTGRRGWRALLPSPRLVLGGFFGFFFALTGLIAVVYAMVKMPDINSLKMPTATVYEYSDGTAFFTAGLQNRVVVPIGQVPATMQHAIVSVENPTFYTDSGVSPRGIVRAFVNDIEGGPLQGGSTITQQFVKNAYLNDDQTFSRKFTEIFKAVKITRAYPKQQILDDYLNTVYFGRGCYGVDAAAETYFGVPVSQITDPSRAAYLAALVNEPTVLSQTDAAAQTLLQQRWNLVLDDMVKTGDVTAAQRAAAQWPAALVPKSGVVLDAAGVDDSAMEQVANVYLDQLHAQNPAVPDSATADAGGDVIVTTFNRAAMTAAVNAVKSGLLSKLDLNDSKQAAVDKGVQVGLATVDARNGELLAVYPGASDFDNATQAQIEPGSQMQAFSLIADEQVQVPAAAEDTAKVQYSRAAALWSVMGGVGLTQNLIADPGELPEPLAKLEVDPQLALGIVPESPARMAAAFTVFPGQGVYRGLAMALSVTVDGRRVWSYAPKGTQAVQPQYANVAFKLLNAHQIGTVPQLGFGQAGAIPGTIGGDLSAWFSGYNGDIVTSVGVWDQSVDAKDRTVQKSLAGLGGLPAAQSDQWPQAVWTDYMTAVTTGSHPALPPGRLAFASPAQVFAGTGAGAAQTGTTSTGTIPPVGKASVAQLAPDGKSGASPSATEK